MNKIKLLICLLGFLLIPIMTHASDIHDMKTSLAEKHGKERCLLLEKYLKEIPADSLKTRFTISLASGRKIRRNIFRQNPRKINVDMENLFIIIQEVLSSCINLPSIFGYLK